MRVEPSAYLYRKEGCTDIVFTTPYNSGRGHVEIPLYTRENAMTDKFKVGDKIVKSYGEDFGPAINMTLGDTYIVKEVENGFCAVEECSGWWRESNFELLEDIKQPSEEPGTALESSLEYFLHRVDLNSHKQSMAIGYLPTNIPFPSIVFDDVIFYRINGRYWEKGHTGCDSEGIYTLFYSRTRPFTG